jgi:excinuclease ABC subunit C
MPALKRKRPVTDAAQLAQMLASVKAGAEDRPGVYRMIAEDGEVVYVGKSKKLRTRLLSYFRAEYPADKGARIVRQAVRVEWDYVPSEFAALLEELRLIKRHRPRLNVAMKRDGRNYCFIKLTGGIAPRLTVVRGPGVDDSAVYYGPFIGAVGVAEAMRELSDALGLRDCSADQKMHFADQPELFTSFQRTPGCIRFEVKKCLGPCVGGCTVHQYAERVDMARGFLEGGSDAPILKLEQEMLAASERLEFERAGAIRDKLQRLEALREQFGRLRFAVETLSFVYNVPGHAGDDRVYLIRRGRVRRELSAPRTGEDATTMLQAIHEVFDAPDGRSSEVPAHEVDELLLLSSWFRRFPAEMARTSAA